jgi:hypothetical protein
MQWPKKNPPSRQEPSQETTPPPIEFDHELCIFCGQNPRVKGDGGRVCWSCILMAGRWVEHPEEVGHKLAESLHEAHGDICELRIGRRTEIVRGPFGSYRQEKGPSFLYWAFNDEAHVPGQVPPYFIEHPVDYPDCLALDCPVHPSL